MPLTEKKRKFCELYFLEKNATKAAVGAGYSAHTATVTGSKLLRDTNVREYLQSLTATADRRAAAATEKTIKKMTDVLTYFSDVMQHADPSQADAKTVKNGIAAAKGLQEHYEGKKDSGSPQITIDKLLVMIGDAKPGKLGETAKGLLTIED